MTFGAITKQTGELDPLDLHREESGSTDPEDLVRITRYLHKLIAIHTESALLHPSAFSFPANNVITYVVPNFPEFFGGSTEKERELKPREINYVINAKLKVIFDNAEYEEFEDGFTSEFSNQLFNIAEKHWRVVHDYISNTINSNDYNALVLSEALITLSEIAEGATWGQRLRLLRKALTSNSPDVRDGAAIGFANMDDPISIAWIQSAIEQEMNAILKRNLELVVEQLEETRDEINL